MHYLYKITNVINNKVYIGQTNSPNYRWYQHCSYAKKKTNTNNIYIMPWQNMVLKILHLQ